VPRKIEFKGVTIFPDYANETLRHIKAEGLAKTLHVPEEEVSFFSIPTRREPFPNWDKIGAALLMLLYPRYFGRTRDIGKVIRVSPGTIRNYRLNEQFKSLVEILERRFAEWALSRLKDSDFFWMLYWSEREPAVWSDGCLAPFLIELTDFLSRTSSADGPIHDRKSLWQSWRDELVTAFEPGYSPKFENLLRADEPEESTGDLPPDLVRLIEGRKEAEKATDRYFRLLLADIGRATALTVLQRRRRVRGKSPYSRLRRLHAPAKTFEEFIAQGKTARLEMLGQHLEMIDRMVREDKLNKDELLKLLEFAKRLTPPIVRK